MTHRIELAGWWQIKFDEQDQGRDLGWPHCPPTDCWQINLPSCWNEVFPDYAAYDGTAWYFKDIFLPAEGLDERVLLCFEGVNYQCEAFVNGQSVGTHAGGFTLFSFEVTRALRPGSINRLAIRVNAELSAWTLPPSGVDWFNYGGIYRTIYFQTTRAAYLDDYTLKTRLDGTVAVTAVVKNRGEAGAFRLAAHIEDQTGQPVARQLIQQEVAAGEMTEIGLGLTIPNPHLWKLRAAYLYHLRLELYDASGQVCDQAEQRFGVREFRASGHKLLLNGEEVKLVGCSKHDEYPLTGRAVTREQLIKDYDLLRQMDANCVRLAHYPHNRLEHEILDELGLVAISEIPMVFLREAQMTSPDMLAKSRQMLAEMIRAERNTTCIMFWSLFIECETDLPSTRDFVKTLVDDTRALDDTRLVVMASNRPLTDVTYELFDVIGVNYWKGWYEGATVQEGIEWLATMARRYPDKPLLITSHGWEGLYGVRSYVEKIPWSEDQQSDYLAKIADVYLSFKNIVGEIIWTFADFRVSNWKDISEPGHNPSYLGRPEMVNHKGVVDFYRRPKSTYYVMQEKFAAWQTLTTPPTDRCGQNLRVRVFPNRRLAGNAVAFDFIDRVQTLLAQKPTLTVLFASAGSQVEFLEGLLRNQMFVDWSRINAFHLDEYVGAGPETPFGFARWLRDHLIDHLPFRRFEALNGQAPDLAAECQRYGMRLGEREIDLACIGIGENGHLAFNDPPVADFEDPATVKIVDLDEACREQQFREGIFPDTASVPRQALTLTLPALMQAGAILCTVPGAHKSVAVWKTLRADITSACPASILRRHPQATLYLDTEAAVLAYPKK
jgi:beta-glucuronidase